MSNSIVIGKINGMDDVAITSDSRRSFSKNVPQFSYSKEVIEAVKNSGYTFTIFNPGTYHHNNKNYHASCVDVSRRMEQFNEENENKDKYYSVGTNCYTPKSIEKTDGFSRSCAPVLFKCNEPNISDPLVPSLIVCAFGWGIERISIPYEAVYVQDRNGYSTCVTTKRWNYQINYESNEEFNTIKKLRDDHIKKYIGTDKEYEFGVGDFIYCCIKPNDGYKYSKNEIICALSLDEYVKEVKTPFIAYFSRTLQQGHMIVWAKIYNCPNYTIKSIDINHQTLVVADKNDYNFPVKWKTWHNALNYECYEDFKRKITNEVQDIEKSDPEKELIDKDLKSFEEHGEFFISGVKPLKN